MRSSITQWAAIQSDRYFETKKSISCSSPSESGGENIVDIFEKWSKEAVKRLVKIIDVATEFKQSFGLFSSFCNSSLFPIIIQCRGVDRDFSRRLAWVRSYRRLAAPHRVRSRHRQSWSGGYVAGARRWQQCFCPSRFPRYGHGEVELTRPLVYICDAAALLVLLAAAAAAVPHWVQWCDVENVVCLAPHKKACGWFYMIVNRICK